MQNQLKMFIVFLLFMALFPVLVFAFDNWQDTDQSTSYTDTFGDESDYFINEVTVGFGLDNGPWPMFGHNVKHSGQSPFKGIPFPLLKWGKWEKNIGNYYSPTIDSNGTIFVISYGGVRSYNSNGSLNWDFPVTHSISSTLTINNDGTLYFTEHFFSGEQSGGYIQKDLVAINSDGSLKWRNQLWTGYHIPAYKKNSSPAIGDDGTIYVGSYDDYLYAVNPDGTLKWSFQTFGDIYSSPAIGDDGTIYIGSYDDYLYAVNPDGTLKWSFQTSGDIHSSPAIGDDGTIYISSSDGYLYAVNPDGTSKWYFQTYGSIFSSPVISANNVIYIYSGGYLYSLDSSGSLVWKKYFDFAQNGAPLTIGTDGTIYMPGRNYYYYHGIKLSCGKIILYALNSDGTIKWEDNIGSDNLCDIYGASSVTIDTQGTIYWNTNSNNNGYAFLRAYGLPDGTGGLYGKITNQNGDLLENITIAVGSKIISSNNLGAFGTSLVPGFYDVTCSTNEYQSISYQNVKIELGESTELNIELAFPGPLNVVTTELPVSEMGIEYNYRVRISGGTFPYIYSVPFGSLPPGLSMDTTMGTLTGIPTSVGTYTFAVAVEDSENTYAEREFSIEVTEKLKITTESTFSRGTKGKAYFGNIEATGGTLPHTFTRISGSLPSGISLSSTGSLTGTPSGTGSYDFTVRVTDASSRTAEKSFHIEIVNPLVISTTRLNNGIVGEAYEQAMSAFGGFGDYVWVVFSGILPTGLSLDSTTGILSGTPTQATNKTIVFAVTDEENRVTYKDLVLQVCDPLKILTASVPNALVSSQYSGAIRLNGGVGPFTFSYIGKLPAGLSLNTSTGVISGTPTTAGYVNVSITVVDNTYPVKQSVTQNLGIRTTNFLTIITSAVLSKGKIGVAMNPLILQAGGGPSPYAWAIVAGQMPSGITLDSATGQISGTPSDRGDFAFTIQVTDDAENSVEKEFFLHVSDTLNIKTSAVPDGAKGKTYSFSFEAEGGLLPYTWRVKSGTLPTGLSFNPTTGTLSGNPTTRQTYSFTLEVNDNDSPAQRVEREFIIEIQDELYIYTRTISNGRMDQAYSATLKAMLGTPPYEWQIESGVLPPGLSFGSSPTTATIEGTPTEKGTYDFTVKVSDNGTPVASKTKAFTLTIYDDVVIETTELKNANRGIAYSEDISVTGGDIPYTWKIIEGSLPAGLSLNSTSGHISGITNLVSGHSSTLTVKVTDAGNPSGFDVKELVLWVLEPLEITTDTIQKAFQKAPFQADFEGVGGIAPYTWSMAQGNLPNGMTIDGDTGTLSGTPAECGTFDFTLKLEDSADVTNATTRAFQLEVICCNDYEITGSTGGLEGVTITLGGDGSGNTTTDAQGNFRFEHLAVGSYTLTPSLSGYRFEPSLINIIDLSIDLSGFEFDALSTAGDVDGSGEVGLIDLIMTLQILCGETLGSDLFKGGDIDGNGTIGKQEAIYILREITKK